MNLLEETLELLHVSRADMFQPHSADVTHLAPPITEVTLRDEDTAEGRAVLTAGPGKEGALVFTGINGSAAIERALNDWDFEYWLTVPAAYKETFLLQLIRERFRSALEVRAWLDERNIPSDLMSWV